MTNWLESFQHNSRFLGPSKMVQLYILLNSHTSYRILAKNYKVFIFLSIFYFVIHFTLKFMILKLTDLLGGGDSVAFSITAHEHTRGPNFYV